MLRFAETAAAALMLVMDALQVQVRRVDGKCSRILTLYPPDALMSTRTGSLEVSSPPTPSLHLSLSLFHSPVLWLSLAFFLSPCLPLSLSPPPSLSISSEAMPDLFGQRGAKASLQLHTLQSHSNALILPFDTPSPSLHPPLHPMLPSPRPFSQRCRNLRAIELPDLIESLKNHHALLMSTEATIKRARSSPSGITPSHRPPPFPQT